MKPKIRLFDEMFSESGVAIGGHQPPSFFDWHKGDEACDIAVFTGHHLDKADQYDCKTKIALLIESPAMYPAPYGDIMSRHKDFDVVLTHINDLADELPNGKLYHLGGCWIEPPVMYHKDHDVSMIFSWKRHSAGQKLRHEVYEHRELFRKKIDFFGRGHKTIKEIDNKLEGLQRYRYSVAIENLDKDFYFTEKLIDCFSTGTVPIYWGCPGIEKIFDPNGMILFSNIEELKFIVNQMVGEYDYDNRTNAIVRNYDRAKRHVIVEDWLWNNVFSLYALAEEAKKA